MSYMYRIFFTGFGGNIPDVLQQAEHRTMTIEECRRTMGNGVSAQLHICAMDEQEIASTCTVRYFD